jgi:hypothetical protein
MIVAPNRVADLVDRFPDLTARCEVRLDSRGRQRRAAPAFHDEERRRRDRRQLDVNARLRMDGWVVIPAAQRHAEVGSLL